MEQFLKQEITGKNEQLKLQTHSCGHVINFLKADMIVSNWE